MEHTQQIPNELNVLEEQPEFYRLLGGKKLDAWTGPSDDISWPKPAAFGSPTERCAKLWMLPSRIGNLLALTHLPTFCYIKDDYNDPFIQLG